MPTASMRLAGTPLIAIVSLGLAVLLAACSSTPTPVLRASQPDIYLHSNKAPQALARCLYQRLPDVREISRGAETDILAGGQRWLIALQADGDTEGTKLAAHKGAGAEEIEPEVRFSIARCAL